MNAIFLKLVNMSLSASWLVLAVILIRLLLKRAPRTVHCTLWGLVAVRLLCPVFLESEISLIPSASVLPMHLLAGNSFNVDTGLEAVNVRVNAYLDDRFFEGVTVPAGYGEQLVTVFTVVWILGFAVMLAYTLFSCMKLIRKVKASVLVGENVFLSDYIDTPFIFGLIKPKIYLPSDMDPNVSEYVLAHERAHLQRRDHWWKPTGYLLLAVYWFNPLLWLAYILLCRDIEMACDEKVVREMTVPEKKEYSEALLTCSIPRRMVTACPLAFGEVGVKKRIRFVMDFQKPAAWIVAAAVVLCTVTAVCFLTNPAGTPLGVFPDPENIKGITVSVGNGAFSVELAEADLWNAVELLENTRIGKAPLSGNRSETRFRTNSVIVHCSSGDEYFYFNKDCSQVWIDNAVKPSLNRRVKTPEQVQAFFCRIFDLESLNFQDGVFYLTAMVLEPGEGSILVDADEDTWDPRLSGTLQSGDETGGDLIWINRKVQWEVPVPELISNDMIVIAYDGLIAETYPAQINRVFAIYRAGDWDGLAESGEVIEISASDEPVYLFEGITEPRSDQKISDEQLDILSGELNEILEERLEKDSQYEGRTHALERIRFADADFSAVTKVRLQNFHGGAVSYLEDPEDIESVAAVMRTVSGVEGTSARGYYEGSYSLEFYVEDTCIFSIGFGDSDSFFIGEYGDGYPIRYTLESHKIGEIIDFLSQFDEG